jgi:hypothetical protein
MQGLYEHPGRFRRLLPGGMFANLENQKQLSRTIGVVYLGLQVGTECKPDHAEEKEKQSAVFYF